MDDQPWNKWNKLFTILCLLTYQITFTTSSDGVNTLPVVVNTWNFTNATLKAWKILTANGSSLDAVEKGCSVCEEEQCDGTVGFGGSPDENGETTLDAMIMDGTTHKVGSVGALRRVKSAISVARYVMEYTKQTLLVGELATQFAVSMGFREESLATNSSREKWKEWKNNSCQPNYWQNVTPNPKTTCGPYKPIASPKTLHYLRHQHEAQDKDVTNEIREQNHDTIGMIAIDNLQRISVGTSTNGLIHKIPGRVGDSPIAGSGGYCDKDVGGAAATGDGDVMMRFLPSYQAVENMRRGMNPTKAAEDAIRRITAYHEDFSGAVVALSINGEHGAACYGIAQFPYSIANPQTGKVVVMSVPCLQLEK